MKITKSQLKEIIRENIDSLPIENLIGGISSLVDGMDPELVGVVFTTVFKEMEGGSPPPETSEEPEATQQIGFDREPEEVSNRAPERIGFEESLIKVIKEEMSTDSALLSAINKLADKIDNLDVSVDYLAASVTGEDPLSLGYGQAAFGRAARKKKIQPPAELAEIIEQEIAEALGTGRMAPVARTLSRAGIAQRSEPTRTELMKLIAALDTGDPEELQQLADMVAQLMDAASENIEQDYGLEVVSSEKQRRWACAQKDKPADERADSLSAAEAEEMCTSKVEEDA